jgi:gliding motility-associated-like protein
MKKVFILLTFFFTINFTHAQIVGTPATGGNIANELVTLLIGEGIEFSNATVTNVPNVVGTFDGTNSNIGLNSGVVMCTDGVDFIEPNSNQAGISTSLIDEDLQLQLELVNASSTSLKNVIVLEFDFIPTSDVLTFDYVFASKEYTSFTCSNYNDIFGFFLSGPGINGPFSNNAINIALVPDPNNPGQYTDSPVIINTINSGSPSGGNSGPCDQIDPNWQDYSVFFIENQLEETVNFNGFTVPLTAQANVEPCASYHIKLALANILDESYDSAVFLEEGSFSAPPDVETVASTNVEYLFDLNSEYSNNVYEGCGAATLTFFRPENVNDSISVKFKIQGSADYMVDYTYSSNYNGDSLIMFPEDDFATFEINPINDWINEGVEIIEVTLNAVDYGCITAEPDTIFFEIHDQPEFNGTISNDVTTQCAGDDALIEVEVSGGVGGLMSTPYVVEPFTYEWSHVGTAPTQVVSPMDTTEYCVEVTDICGAKFVDCVTVNVMQYPSLKAESELKYVCEDVREEICVEAEDGAGFYTYLWSNGSTDDCIFDYHNEYTVVVTDACNEEVTAEGEIYLDEASDPLFQHLGIPHTNLGAEFNNHTEFMPGLAYSWDFGDGQFSDSEEPIHIYDVWGEYDVTLGVTTAIAGCYKEIVMPIQVEPLTYFYAPNAFTPNGDDKNDSFKASVVGYVDYELFIYDRWGKQVFYTTDTEESWDGSYGGELAAQGTYVFKAVMKKAFNNTVFEEFGSVTLIR